MDPERRVWVPDAPYSQGGSLSSGSGVSNPIGYTERVWNSNSGTIGERIAVTSMGYYNVTIYLDELSYQSPGMRSFNIAVGDQEYKMLFPTNIDLFAAYGFGNLKSFPIEIAVTTGIINIRMIFGSASNPKLNGFSIVYIGPVSPSSQPSSSPSLPPSSRPSHPTRRPSLQPLASPTNRPSTNPSAPTNLPSSQPTLEPIIIPTQQPSIQPSSNPSSPSVNPTDHPTRTPSNQPKNRPTRKPVNQPSHHPFTTPSTQPSQQPLRRPTLRPTIQPSSRPSHPSTEPSTEPSNQPMHRPSDQPTRQPFDHPTSRPTSRPSSYPSAKAFTAEWYFSSASDIRSIPFLVMYSLNGFFTLAGIYANNVMRNKKEGRKIALQIGVLNLVVCSMFTFVKYCARCNFWLKNEIVYHPYFTDDSNQLVFATPEYFSATKSTLKNAQCPFNNQHPQGYNSASGDQCTFLNFNFSLKLIQEGEAKFAIGFGLIIFAGLQCIILAVEIFKQLVDKEKKEEEKERKEREDAESGKVVDKSIKGKINGFLDSLRPSILIPKLFEKAVESSIMYIFTLIVGSQQCCALLLLTYITANPYCAVITVPTE